MRIGFLLICLTLFIVTNTLGQSSSQNIRGTIIDTDNRLPLVGVNIAVYKDSTLKGGTTSDLDGRYKIPDLPVGRYTIVTTYIGYRTIAIPNVILNSGKETILNLEMEEATVKMDELVVTATKKGETLNEMATVSARTFSVDETERYAGSRGDPARMASNFAGVQGADDSRNDIVIRGNSPLGVLWRLDDVNIPNPNHFAIAGTQGGPVSIINNKVLSNSDFFTGAFPAEYGNSIAGVFDLKMRNGNNQNYEFTGQFGLLGTELSAEGPISKEKRSSFLVNYRYSTLAMFGSFGIPIGTNAVPKYQDAAFKLNFPNKKGFVSLFGIGGMSDIDIVVSETLPSEREIYGQNDRDQYFGTSMGVVGLNYLRSLTKNTYAKVTLAHAVEENHSNHYLIYNQLDSVGNFLLDDNGFFLIDSLVHILNYSFMYQKSSVSAYINSKVNARHVIKAGVVGDYYFINMMDSAYNAGTTHDWSVRWNFDGTAFLLQPFIQWKWKVSEKVTFNTGLHSQYFNLNNSFSPVEPRFGVKWEIDQKNVFSFGTGLHSQLQPLYAYFYQLPDPSGGFVRHNIDMDFTRSWHFVLGYDRSLGKNTRIKAETYYQSLFDVPVSVDPSSFSLLNQGSGFSRFFPDTLTNRGTGTNYGIEMTLEKFFSKSYFFMITASLYESTYKGSDGITRDTDFNGNYALNLLAGKEFKIGEKSSFNIGLKLTYAGNKRYGPVDTTETIIQGEAVFVDSTRNIWQFPDYFRTDLKLNYKINAKKITHEIGIDLVNVTNRQNVLKITYAPDPGDPTLNPIREEYQLGFLPIFYYKIDF